MCRVSRVYRTENREILNLMVANSDGREEIIGVTPNHRFWVAAKGWTEARDLVGEDILQDLDGRSVSVVAASKLDDPTMTYNLEVDDFHTYFVGKTGVWVHNGGPAVCPANFSKGLNLREASQLLGGPARKSWSQVTVGELRNLAAGGSISRTNLTTTLRGKSTSMRRELLQMGEMVLEHMGVKDGALVRISEQIVGVPRSAARDGSRYHVGHFGEAFTNLVDTVGGSMPVSEFRKYHWYSSFLESGWLNVLKGAGLGRLDMEN